MSRAYRITVQEALSRHVQVEDGVCSSLELLPILPAPRLAVLLADELGRRGFTVEGPEARRVEGDGVEVRVALATGEVKVTARHELAVELSTERTAVTEQLLAEPRRAALQAQARAALEAEAHQQELATQAEVTAQLEGRLKDLKGELEAVGTRVTAAALEERARELGEVQSVEGTPDGGLVIRVKV